MKLLAMGVPVLYQGLPDIIEDPNVELTFYDNIICDWIGYLRKQKQVFTSNPDMIQIWTTFKVYDSVLS